MSMEVPRPSAKIYQFPIRPRKSVETGREETALRTGAVSRMAAVAVGSGWYHDAAIQESKRPRER